MKGKFMTAKFPGVCHETGNKIKKGEDIFYSFTNRKAYSRNSQKYAMEQDRKNVAEHIHANENAYFDNFCVANNI
tara:strand:+ start:836 stop:1060 length:225 start_codon:yes stop_codon:yes gene_type:complete